jgi:hypothetical protein
LIPVALTPSRKRSKPSQLLSREEERVDSKRKKRLKLQFYNQKRLSEVAMEWEIGKSLTKDKLKLLRKEISVIVMKEVICLIEQLC